MDQLEGSLGSILRDEQFDCETKQCQTRFPEKLHEVLWKAKERGYDHVMSWLPSGTSFKIHNKLGIEQVVMPIHFPGMKCYKSFRRQLNLYSIHQDKGMEE
jgi:hypothetical protein